jgi:23S rRNA (uracil1939-C5)-methyltransferase
MARKKNKELIIEKVRFTGIADKGKAVGRNAEGIVVFAEDVAPEDVADVRVTKKKNSYIEGIATTFHEYSPDRVTPFCRHFEFCGGCKWQHLDYAAQLRHKQKVVEDTMQHLAKVPIADFQPILGVENPRFYRNKLEFTFSNKRWLTPEEFSQGLPKLENVLGFHRAGAFDKILPIEECFLQPDPSNGIRNTLMRLVQEQNLTCYDVKLHTGLMRNVMIRITTLGEIMVLVAFATDEPKVRKNLFEALLQAFPQITSLMYCINPKVNDFMLDLPMYVYHGRDYIEEQLGAVRFRISAKSFFQTNTLQATRLFDTVTDFAQFNGTENVYDLYTGIGSIALYIANRVRHVVGIEEIAAAIDDAKDNAALNGLTNTTFYAGDVKNILTTEFAAQHGKPDLLITDPPRAGMHPSVVEMLLTLAAPRLVYVSCNPATQARDLALLHQKYEVLKMRPVDMFPHTHHVENVAMLQLR